MIDWGGWAAIVACAALFSTLVAELVDAVLHGLRGREDDDDAR